MSGSRQVIVNSRLCPVVNTTYRNRCTVSLSTPILCPKSCDAYATVIDAQIPNTYNQVDTRNSAVSLTFRYGTLSVSQTYNFPTGNYTTSTLASTWGSNGKIFNFTLGGAACSANVALTVSGSQMSMKINSTTGTPTGAGASPSWSVQVTSPLLGFSTQSFTTTATVGATLPQLSMRYYLIGSSLNTFNQLPVSGYEAPVKVLCKIPLTAAPGYTEQFVNPCASPLKVANRVISEFQIAVLDEFGNDLNLLYNDWSCCVQIEFLPKITDGPDYWEEISLD